MNEIGELSRADEIDFLPYTVVLCRVKEAGNVGSVCRAMKTMGFQKLALADCPEYDEAAVAMMAVHAFDVYEGARRFATLHEALQASTLSAGFSRRVGSRRKAQSLELGAFAKRLIANGQEQVHLVFGNERDGLSDAELEECNLAVHIPSSSAFPSLNVAQAVQVACYELRMAFMNGKAAANNINPATRARVEVEMGTVIDLLAQNGAFRKSDSDFAFHYLIDVCERASLTIDEVQYLRKLFEKTSALSHRTR